jgi:hypothetical protein
MKRLDQVVLIAAFVGFSWLAMQAVHELGHIVAAWATGAEVERVVLHPLTISRTDLGVNPHPGTVAWAGPIAGAILPLAAWAAAWACRAPGPYLFRFFAGFCLVANGCYIGAGSFQGIGDAGVMLAHSSPQWTLVLFGLVTAPTGLCLWHGQGRHFGLGDAQGKVDRTAAAVAACLLLATVAAELAALRGAIW